jgi:hypothetical protein
VSESESESESESKKKTMTSTAASQIWSTGLRRTVRRLSDSSGGVQRRQTPCCMSLLISTLVWGSSACSPEPTDPSLSLSEPDQVALSRFVDDLREVYSRGDARGVEAFIAEDFEHRVIDLARRHILPKGPTKILGYQIIPYSAPKGPVFTLSGVDYELTVEPLGKLIFDVEDVSIGKMQIGFVVGRRDGLFRIAGYQSVP